MRFESLDSSSLFGFSIKKWSFSHKTAKIAFLYLNYWEFWLNYSAKSKIFYFVIATASSLSRQCVSISSMISTDMNFGLKGWISSLTSSKRFHAISHFDSYIWISSYSYERSPFLKSYCSSVYSASLSSSYLMAINLNLSLCYSILCIISTSLETLR